MRRQNLTIAAVAAFALGLSPVLGRRSEGNPGGEIFRDCPASRRRRVLIPVVRIQVLELVRLGIERLVLRLGGREPGLRGAARAVPSKPRREWRSAAWRRDLVGAGRAARIVGRQRDGAELRYQFERRLERQLRRRPGGRCRSIAARATGAM